jgi:hypothetical protein
MTEQEELEKLRKEVSRLTTFNGRLRDRVIAQASRIAGLELVIEAYASKERTDEARMGD